MQLTINSTRALIVSVLSLYSGLALSNQEIPVAEDPMQHVQSLSAYGCGQGISARLEQSDAMSELLVIDFDQLVLDASSGASSLSCKLSATIKVPEGMRFGIKEGAVNGYGDMAALSGLVKFRYSAPSIPLSAESQKALPPHQLTELNLQAVPSQVQSTCRNSNESLRLDAELLLKLGSGTRDQSAIRITGSNLSYGTAWHWVWMDCFTGQFRSAYQAYDGRTYQAQLDIRGTEGSYRSSAGFTGRLSQIRREGRTVKANWHASGRSGWLEFRVLDFASGRFDGFWGDESGQKGRWYGSF